MRPTTALLGLVVAVAVAGAARPAADASARHPRAPDAMPSAPRRGDVLQGLPAGYDVNEGQFDDRVRFVARGGGIVAWLVDGETVLSLGADDPGLSEPARRAHAPTRSGGVLRMRFPSASRPRGEARLASTSNWFLGDDPTRWRTDVTSFGRTRYESAAPGVDVVWRGTRRALEYDVVVAPGADLGAFSIEMDGARSVAIEPRSGDLVVTMPGGAELRQSHPRCFQVAGGVRRDVAGRFVVDGARVSFAAEGRDRTLALVVDPVLEYSTFLGGNSVDAGYATAVSANGDIVVTGQTISSNFPLAGAVQPVNLGLDAFVARIRADGTGLVFSTYFGGSAIDSGEGIAVDTAGGVYVAGNTNSSNLPTVSAVQTLPGGAREGFVVKLVPAGNQIAYSTYLGGNQDDFCNGVAVDSSGSAYVVGVTLSTNFPTAAARQSTHGGNVHDAFVTKLSPSGASFAYSTFHGGNGTDFAYGCAVDAGGALVLGGYSNSTNLPINNAFQSSPPTGGAHGFVAKYNAAGSALVFGTFLGGSGYEIVYDVAVDGSGTVCVCGQTSSTDFPTVAPTQSAYGGGAWDAFASRFQPSGNSLAFSTYLGGSADDVALAIATDASGGLAVAGYTGSSNFPVVKALRTGYGGGTSDGFVARFSPGAAAPVCASWFGGSAEDRFNGIAFDANGNLCLSGYTFSPDFPVLSAFQSIYGGGAGGGDAVVVRLAPTVPAGPTGLAAVLVGTSGVHVTWIDQSGDETGFEIQRRLNAGAFTTYGSLPAGTVSFDDTSIFASQTYTYRVRAVGVEGASAMSNEVSVTTPGTVPAPPLPRPPDGLQALVVSSSEVDLTWNDRSNDEMLFEVQRADGGAPFATVGTVPLDIASFVDATVLPGWPVSYRVRALAVQGPSLPSAVVTVTPPAVMTLVTSKGLVVDAKKARKDKLTWSATFTPSDATAMLDPKAQGLRLQAGRSDAPVVVVIPPGDSRWKTKKSRFTWKGGGGAMPKVTVVLDTAKKTLSLTATVFDYSPAPTGPVRMLVAVGGTSGGLSQLWVAGRKLGTFVSPRQ